MNISLSPDINIPRHVAIIMDGSGRWAKERKKSRKSGHNAGALAVKRTIEFAAQSGIKSLSLYAFSKENWRRPQEEIEHLMRLFLRVLKNNKRFLNQHNVRFNPIGDLNVFSSELQSNINKLVLDTAANSGLILNIAVNYSGQWDITQAASKIIGCAFAELKDSLISDSQVLNQDKFLAKLSELTAKYQQEDLLTSLMNQQVTVSEQDPIDLIIRTSNEQRLSNFFLWQAAYSEFVFVEEYWPDFDAILFTKAIEAFSKRQRRFGGLNE